MNKTKQPLMPVKKYNLSNPVARRIVYERLYRRIAREAERKDRGRFRLCLDLRDR